MAREGFRRTSFTSQERAREIVMELERPLAAKLLGVRPERLDKWLGGKGQTRYGEARRLGKIKEDLVYYKQLQRYGRYNRLSERKINALAVRAQKANLDTAKGTKAFGVAMGTAGVPSRDIGVLSKRKRRR